MITMMIEVIGVGPSRPRSAAAPAPLEDRDQDAVRAADATAGSCRGLERAPATERNTSISSRNETAMTAPMNSGSVLASWAFRSSVIAVMPET